MYVSLSVDCPVLELFSLSVRNSCNRIFLFDYEQYLEIQEENPSCIFYLPLAVNVNRWDSVLQECQGPCYDLSFVGSLYTEKSPLPGLPLSPADKKFCSRLVQAQLPLPGLSLCEEGLTEPVISALQEADPGFPALPDGVMDTAPYVALHYYLGMEVSSRERIQLLNVLGSQQDFETHLFTRSDSSVLKGVVCHGGVSTHREMPLIFRQSRINLNLTIRSIQTGLSQRIWDILGCGGFLLTDYRAELPKYFEIGKELDCYESPEECLEKVRYYLTHEDIRAEIAAKGYEKVKAMHTYEIRIAHMLKLIFP
jgi:spore maturation protein CgeB